LKTLLYLASGIYNPAYENLPYDQIICVDRCSELVRTYPRQGSKVRFIGRDALFAIDQLKNEGVQVHALVSMNEGLFEGGGSYPIFSGFLMGYLSPILAEELVLICDLSYYNQSNMKGLSRLDWGFEKVREINRGDEGFMDPHQFYNNPGENPNRGNQFILRKANKKTLVQNQHGVDVQILQRSLWEDESRLDFIAFPLTSRHELLNGSEQGIHSPAEFFRHKGVMDIENLTFYEILDLAHHQGAQKLGLGPWNKGQYREVFEILQSNHVAGFQSIYFYHLSPNDYRELYRCNEIANNH